MSNLILQVRVEMGPMGCGQALGREIDKVVVGKYSVVVLQPRIERLTWLGMAADKFDCVNAVVFR